MHFGKNDRRHHRKEEKNAEPQPVGFGLVRPQNFNPKEIDLPGNYRISDYPKLERKSQH